MRQVSGVGGQFDFVSMAHELPDARSIINCRSTRETIQGFVSNIIWEYPNVTIPRYLRDIVITEYGIADCRSKTDAEVIKSLLNITDSRFQSDLLMQAKKNGKLPQNYEIPDCFKNNIPEHYNAIVQKIQNAGYFSPYPFGNELTPVETELQNAFLFLKYSSKFKLIKIMLSSFIQPELSQYEPYLSRMNLAKPKSFREFIYKRIVIAALRQTLQ